jgi:hypothetical protein
MEIRYQSCERLRLQLYSCCGCKFKSFRFVFYQTKNANEVPSCSLQLAVLAMSRSRRLHVWQDSAQMERQQ